MRLIHSSFLFPLSLLLVATLPLSGCDSVGSGGDDNGDSESLTAPSDVTATSQTGAVELTWSSVDAAGSYNIYRSTSETDGVSGDPLQSNASGTSYVDESAESGTTYYYRITAVSDDQESDPSSEVSATAAVASPSTLEATPRDGSVDLTWESVDAASSYNVYRSTSSSEEVSGEPLASDVSNASFTDTEANNGTTYYYRVTALANETESAGSNEATAEMPAASPGNGSNDSWTRVKVGTDQTIHDVAMTANGAYAVAEGGILLKRQPDEGQWTVEINDGPSSNGSNLYGLAVTENGNHLWLVGSSGRIGEFNVNTGSLVADRSAPNDATNNFRDVAVTGTAGSANVYIVGASGQVYNSFDNGSTGTWNATTPGNGSALRAIDFYDTRSGTLVDGNQTVFETSDGSTWSDIGISDSDVGFYGVDADATNDMWVAGGNGTVFQWDGSMWTSTKIGEPTLSDIEVGSDGNGFATGGSGALFHYDGSAWSRADTPTSENLNAVFMSTSQDTPSIAVGAGGTILEK